MQFIFRFLDSVRYWSLALVEDVQTPDAFQEAEENSVLKLLLELGKRENIPGKIERVRTQDKSGMVELESKK